MFLGLFVRRAPAWSLWSTLLVGLAASVAMQQLVTDATLARLLRHPPGPLGNQELNDLRITVFTAVLLVVCTAWFLLTALIARPSPAERARIEAFFAEINTPIDPATEHAGEAYESDARQYKAQAVLSLTFGGFVAALALLPNTLPGRVGLACCGGVTVVIGLVLQALARRRGRRRFDEVPDHPCGCRRA
jgi:hypothetical protein